MRNDKGSPSAIIGFRQDGSSAVQTYRYPTDSWTEAKARKDCAAKGGQFEPALDRAIRRAAGKGD